ncbi:hypothetical protein OIE68_12695 [Nocardia vinacea]|uniref:TRADD-N-associated membrane domain-containing protein n=1 Tax=Nocardia vinacea TaxID=96468 RepID=UPI002E166D79|nr:hypothetical protein OIE68_12695 [Nocardia vinacea]
MSSAIESLAKADPGNIQEVAASQLAISNDYYESVLRQASRSFVAAIVSAGVGLLFFVCSVAFAMISHNLDAALISSLAGGIVEVISGLNFWLYGRTALQLDAFHLRLERTQRYLLANSMSSNLSEDARSQVIADLVRAMVDNGGTTR